MTAEFWEKAESLFLEAVELDPEQRAVFMTDLEKEDPELHREVAEMLRGDAEASENQFLDKAMFNWDEQGLESAPGDQIGRYEIQRKIGEGGMGVVYLARQAQPIERDVALKLIKAGMDSRQVVARFRLEQHTLAKLKHPYIAHVYDGGITEQGRPYFAMEYIDGTPISDWCDDRRYTIEERLRLFLRLCDAVHYAHRRGCLHRDLKPANILVCEQDGTAVPKIIDFGIAKATAGDANPGVTIITHAREQGQGLTQVGGVLGSMGYMSPEQAVVGEHDIDVRCDVYSLGVVLFELLIGTLPHPLTLQSHSSWEQVLTDLREREAPKPSRFPNLEAGDIEKVTEARATSRGQLTALLQRDLDWVVLKALAKDRERRYDSVRDLALDIEHFLANEPVSACPPTWRYRLGKYVARHRYAAGAVAVLFTGLLLGMIGLGAGLVRAKAAERHAVEEAERAKRMVNLMDSFLSSPDPEKQGKDLKVVTLLDNFSGHLSAEGEGPSRETALLHRTIGKTYLGLGVYDRARDHFQTSLDLLEGDSYVIQAERMTSTYHLVTALRRLGKIKESLPLIEKVVVWRSENFGDEAPDTLNAIGVKARLLRMLGRRKEASPLFEHVFAAQEKRYGFEHPTTLFSANGLASFYMRSARPADAEPLYQRILEARTKLLGPEHPRTLETQVNLLILAHQQLNYEATDAQCQATLDACKRVYGEEHSYTILAKTLRAAYHAAQGRYEQAESMFAELLASNTKRFGAEHPNTLDIKTNFAALYHRWGRYQQSADMNEAVYRLRAKTLGENHLDTLGSQSNMAFSLYKLGDLEKAEAVCRDNLARRTTHLGENHYETLISHKILGTILYARDRPAEALTHLETAKPMLDQLDSKSDDALDLQYYLLACQASVAPQQMGATTARDLLTLATTKWASDDERLQQLRHWAKDDGNP